NVTPQVSVAWTPGAACQKLKYRAWAYDANTFSRDYPGTNLLLRIARAPYDPANAPDYSRHNFDPSFSFLDYLCYSYIFNCPSTVAVTLQPNPPNAGNVTGSGTYAVGASVTATATPAAGCIFLNWTEGGTVVSSSPAYSFTASTNRNLAANFAVVTVSVTVQTSPSGRSFTVDGTTYTTAQTFTWASGSAHTIVTTSPQSGATGTQHVWSSWSDGGAMSHTVGPTANATYTANFATQYLLTMSAGTGGTVAPASGWQNNGASMGIGAMSTTGYAFSGWTGTGSGSYSGLSNPASVTMSGPISETASFTNTSCTYVLTPTATNISASAVACTFVVSAAAGCGWTATTTNTWLHTARTGSGNGTATFTADANGNTSTRTGAIAVQDQFLIVNQAGTSAPTINVLAKATLYYDCNQTTGSQVLDSKGSNTGTLDEPANFFFNYSSDLGRYCIKKLDSTTAGITPTAPPITNATFTISCWARQIPQGGLLYGQFFMMNQGAYNAEKTYGIRNGEIMYQYSIPPWPQRIATYARTGGWQHHVWINQDNGDGTANLRMYVDGAKLYDGQLAASEYSPIVGTHQKFLVQRPWSMLYYSFIGEICNIAAFDGMALSDSEVSQLYTVTNPRQYQDRPVVFGSNRSGTNSIWRMNPDGSGLTQLTSNPQGDGGPRWSPDGSAIAFVRGTNLMLMSPDGSNQRVVSSFINGYGAIRWAPDHSYLSYAKRTISDWYAPYYRINLDGTGEALFLDQYGKTTILGFHPSGNSVVWAGATGNSEPSAEIYTAPISGGIVSLPAATRLTSNSAAENCPSYSPDGSTIMFTRTDSGSGYGNPHNIHIVNVDGTNDRKLTSYTGSDSARFPVWSPSGNQIIYQRESGGRTCLILNDLTSSSETQLTGPTYDASEPDWCMAWTTINSGLVAYYPFDGNARDASGNGNDGTVNGAVPTSDRNGKAGGAYYFGRGNYILVPNSTTLNSPASQVTVCAWARIDALDGGRSDWGPIVCKATSGSWHYCLEAYNGGSGGPPTALFLGAGIGMSISPAVNLGQWHYLVATYDGAVAIAYQDGREVGRISFSGSLSVNNDPVYIGADLPGSAEYMIGAIDEVRIYNRALNGAEVAALAGVTTVQMPLSITTWGDKPVLTWPFGSLLSADDLSGPWTPVIDATSPWTNTAASGTKFYRLRP
ncbi:MAG: hypothetical protein NT154_12655, partial [Verrucomicrobia bacterium]|nr:hypothetical protein [Verrucomicrobiota bacterium]